MGREASLQALRALTVSKLATDLPSIVDLFRVRDNVLEPPNHGRFVIGESERLPCPHAMSRALDPIKLAVYTCRAQLVAKSFRLSKRHNIIVGAVNQ
jgi:hypothetical protein